LYQVSHSYLSSALGAVLTSLTSSALCNGFSSAGLEGKDVIIFAKNTQWFAQQENMGTTKVISLYSQRMTPTKNVADDISG
jgi:hypothetical protein